MKQKIINALKTVYDPEIPVNIYDLGLIYDIVISDKRQETSDTDTEDKLITYHLSLITIKMTFTSPTCPMIEEIFDQVKSAVGNVSGLPVDIELVWDPPWDVSRMSDVAKLELDLTESGW